MAVGKSETTREKGEAKSKSASFRRADASQGREAEIRRLKGFVEEMQRNLAYAHKRLDELLNETPAWNGGITITFIDEPAPRALPVGKRAAIVLAEITPEREEREEEAQAAPAAQEEPQVPYEKWLWSWALVKKIAKRAEGQDFTNEKVEDFSRNAVLSESDLDRLELRMQAEGDWKILRNFLESIYDFAEMEKDPAVTLPTLRGAVRDCRQLQLKIDGMDFDFYASHAAMVVAKMVMAGGVDIGDTRIDAGNGFLEGWVNRVEELNGAPETIFADFGEGEEQAPKEKPNESRSGRGLALAAGALGLAAAFFAGWMLMRPNIGDQANAEVPRQASAVLETLPPVQAPPSQEAASPEKQKPEEAVQEETHAKKKAGKKGAKKPEKEPLVPDETAHNPVAGKIIENPSEKAGPQNEPEQAKKESPKPKKAKKPRPAGIDLDEW